MGQASDDDSIQRLEDQLERAVRTLSRLGSLSDPHAERVAQRMDRLASQLLEASTAPPIAEVHERLGTVPADPEELSALVARMGPADGAG